MQRIIIAALLLFVSIPTALAQTATPKKLDELVQMIESKTEDIQGGAMAILYKGKVVYKKTFGYRKGDQGEIDSSTLFPLASVSKPVAAMAIALLVDKGKVRLDERFKLPCLKNPVTLKHILSHTTGYNFLGNPQIEKGIGRKKLLEKLKQQKPQCAPGGCFTYSNAMYSLAEDALQTKGISLQTAIGGLRNALNTKGVQLVPINKEFQVAYPHVDGEHGMKTLPFPPFYPKATPAAAGVFASLDGMIEVFKLSFGYRPDLVSEKTLNLMQTPVISNRDIDNWGGFDWPCDPKQIESFYALGWRILKDKNQPGKEMIFHGGSIAGISTFIGYVPAEEIGVIILLNQGSRVAPGAGITFWYDVIN